jgi:preprotein translocase subunit SecY
MFRKFFLVLKDSELRTKMLKIVLLLIGTRLLAQIPIPLFDLKDLSPIIDQDQTLGLLNTIAGGSFGKLSFVMLGIGPYITASIVMQLMGIIVPSINAIRREEGDMGQQKINRWTRFLAVPISMLNAWGILQFLSNAPIEQRIVTLPDQLTAKGITLESTFWWLVVIGSMTAGSIIMMWVGEIINEYKMGNGISMIILAGIASKLPSQLIKLVQDSVPSFQLLFQKFSFSKLFNLDVWKAFLIENPTWFQIRAVAFFFGLFLFTLLFVVFFNDAVRKIIIIYSKRGHVEGKSRTLNSVKADLPIKVNLAGVMPIIFAVSLILFPSIISRFFFTANVPEIRNAADSIVKFMDSGLSDQGRADRQLPGSPTASFAGVYTTNSVEELKVGKSNDYTLGQDILGFTISTKSEQSSKFFENTFLQFELPGNNLGFLPSTIIAWNGVMAYLLLYFLLIVFFTYFFTSEIGFKTGEISEDLQKSGAYIPGYKPGKETESYLSYVSNRINVFGAFFLAIIAILPIVFQSKLQIGDGTLTGIVGGTTILILVAVTVESLQQIDAQATNVDYDRFKSF